VKVSAHVAIGTGRTWTMIGTLCLSFKALILPTLTRVQGIEVKATNQVSLGLTFNPAGLAGCPFNKHSPR
jgi:hypothetical protein